MFRTASEYMGGGVLQGLVDNNLFSSADVLGNILIAVLRGFDPNAVDIFVDVRVVEDGGGGALGSGPNRLHLLVDALVEEVVV